MSAIVFAKSRILRKKIYFFMKNMKIICKIVHDTNIGNMIIIEWGICGACLLDAKKVGFIIVIY